MKLWKVLLFLLLVKTEKKYVKEILLTGTFGIPFEPFLKNAEPLEEAKTVVIESIDKRVFTSY